MVRRKGEQSVVSVSYKDEFTPEKLKELKLDDELVTDEVIATLELKDELADDQFAIVQKTDEGLKRRFSLVDETSVKLAAQLIDSAEDLTEAELTKAKKSIAKAAKKLGIECSCKDEKVVEEAKEPVVEAVVEEQPAKTIESLTDELVAMLKEVKLEDGAEKPIDAVLTALAEIDGADSFIGTRLESQGKEIVEKGSIQALTDELTEAKEEISLLDEQNRELNYQVRVALVDEILTLKDIQEEEVEAERTKLSKFTYDALKEIAGEFRKTLTKTKDVVINNKEKEVATVKDPTLADEQGVELEENGQPKLADEATEQPKLTKAQLSKALEDFFRASRY